MNDKHIVNFSPELLAISDICAEGLLLSEKAIVHFRSALPSFKQGFLYFHQQESSPCTLGDLASEIWQSVPSGVNPGVNTVDGVVWRAVTRL